MNNTINSFTVFLIYFDDLVIILGQIIFLSICCGYRHAKRLFFLESALTASFFYGMIFFLEFLTNKNPYAYHFNFLVCGFVFSVLFLKHSFSEKMILCVLYFTTFVQLSVLDRAVGYFINLSFGVQIPVRLIGLSGLLILLLLFCLWKKKTKLIEKIPSSYWYYIFSASIFYYLICNIAIDYLHPNSFLEVFWMLLIALGTFSLNIANVLLCRKLVVNYEAKLDLFVTKQRQISDNQIMEETERLYQEVRNMRHELQNHLFVLHALARQQDTEALLSYLTPMCQKQEQWKDEFVDTGNLIANAILNPKISQAKAAQISITVNAHLPRQLSIENQEFCSLLSNLLNNALEASVKTSHPEIYVDIAQKKCYLCIKVKNSALTNVLKENPNLKTDKPDAEHHGIGIRIIRSITDKYDGLLDFRMEEQFFVAEVFLKLKGTNSACSYL